MEHKVRLFHSAQMVIPPSWEDISIIQLREPHGSLPEAELPGPSREQN